METFPCRSSRLTRSTGSDDGGAKPSRPERWTFVADKGYARRTPLRSRKSFAHSYFDGLRRTERLRFFHHWETARAATLASPEFLLRLSADLSAAADAIVEVLGDYEGAATLVSDVSRRLGAQLLSGGDFR